jgi:hypothetical protein
MTDGALALINAFLIAGNCLKQANLCQGPMTAVWIPPLPPGEGAGGEVSHAANDNHPTQFGVKPLDIASRGDVASPRIVLQQLDGKCTLC